METNKNGLRQTWSGSERQNEAQARLDSGEAPDEILRDLLGQIDPSGMAEKIGILRESVGLTDAATRAFWIGLTGLGIDHGDTEIEMGLFIALFLGVRASQAAQDRSAS